MTDPTATMGTTVEDDDDRPVGRVLSRRAMLALLGTAGAAAIVAACTPQAVATAALTAGPTATSAPTPPTGSAGGGATPAATVAASTVFVPACVVVPALTEGPYFVDEQLQRSDIRSDPASGVVEEGVPLTVSFAVAGYRWPEVPAGLPGHRCERQRHVRHGVSRLVPGPHGPYPVQGANQPGRRERHRFTSQLFFEDSLSDQVFAVAPYSQKGVDRGTRNANDGIFRQGNGQLTLAPIGDVASGFAATFAAGITA